MDYLIPILLITFFTWVNAFEPLAVMMDRRRNTYPVYASDFMEEYEPYAVAAIPIQAPVPIFQVLSPSTYSGKYRKHPKKTQSVRDLQAYSSDIDHGYQSYEPYKNLFEQIQPYNNLFEDQPKYPKRELYEPEPAPVVIYARPNKNGGFTYRKPASSSFKPQKIKNR